MLLKPEKLKEEEGQEGQEGLLLLLLLQDDIRGASSTCTLGDLPLSTTIAWAPSYGCF
jgi:hypothetical protein